MGQTLGGAHDRILLRSLGAAGRLHLEITDAQFLPSLLFHRAKGGFLIPLPQRRGTALSAQLHNIAPECSALPHSLHICTNTLLPQSCVFPPPRAISLVRMSTGHGRMAAELLVSTPNSFPMAASSLSALTEGAWQSLDPFFLPLGCGADRNRCSIGLGTPLCLSS